jgi:lysozyme
VKISSAGISLIKRFAILDYHSHRDNHGWVIGYRNRDFDLPGLRVTPEMHITQEQAERMLLGRAAKAEICINACVGAKLSQDQFDALCSYVYWMADMRAFESGPFPELLNAGKFDDVGLAIMTDVQINREVYEGFAKRRYTELKLFLHGD